MTDNRTPVIIGLTGCSGSGKTTFIQNVSRGFRMEEICVLTQDNYYKVRDLQPVDQNGVMNFDLPQSIDHNQFHVDLLKLKNGEPVRIREYLYNKPDKERKVIKLVPARLILVEGIFIYHIPEINALFDYRLYMESHEALMLQRRLIRDELERGYGSDDVHYRFENHVLPSFNQYILPYRESCDLVIQNHTGFEKAAEIIRAFIQHALSTQPEE
jgi:uridine kinase